jgi:hypothetical protein
MLRKPGEPSKAASGHQNREGHRTDITDMIRMSSLWCAGHCGNGIKLNPATVETIGNDFETCEMK